MRPFKDFRLHLPQAVLGIVLDEQDRPIASSLWLSNTADVTVLLPVVVRCTTASACAGPAWSPVAA